MTDDPSVSDDIGFIGSIRNVTQEVKTEIPAKSADRVPDKHIYLRYGLDLCDIYAAQRGSKRRPAIKSDPNLHCKDVDSNMALLERLSFRRKPREPLRASGPARVGFFDQFSRFYSTGKIGLSPNRLNQRYKALIESNLAMICERSILDIASHDGRWSFAACKAGAKRVVGIEVQPDLVENAIANMRAYGVPEEQFRFVHGDALTELERLEPGTIDTVFLFGFFYHTIHHMRLLSQVAALRPQHMILDTEIDRSAGNIVRVHKEMVPVANGGDRISTVVGVPSRSALELMLSSFGWNFTYYDWPRTNKQGDGLDDYHVGTRITLVASCGASV